MPVTYITIQVEHILLVTASIIGSYLVLMKWFDGKIEDVRREAKEDMKRINKNGDRAYERLNWFLNTVQVEDTKTGERLSIIECERTARRNIPGD